MDAWERLGDWQSAVRQFLHGGGLLVGSASLAWRWLMGGEEKYLLPTAFAAALAGSLLLWFAFRRRAARANGSGIAGTTPPTEDPDHVVIDATSWSRPARLTADTTPFKESATTHGPSLATDAARGAGYALLVWPLAVAALGFPIGWWLIVAALGLGLLTYGLVQGSLAGRPPSLVLTTPQSGAFLVATLVWWAAFGSVVGWTGEDGASMSCRGDTRILAYGGTNVTVVFTVPAGVDGVVARLAGESQGAAAFTAPNGTNYVRIATVEGVAFRLERNVGAAWGPVGGGGVENGTHGFGYDEDFGVAPLRVVATAAGSRDGSSQPVQIRFERVQPAGCVTY